MSHAKEDLSDRLASKNIGDKIDITCKSSLEALSNQLSHAAKNCVKHSKNTIDVLEQGGKVLVSNMKVLFDGSFEPG